MSNKPTNDNGVVLGRNKENVTKMEGIHGS